MASQLFANFASAKLASAIASGDTTLDLQAGQGAEFPTISGSDYFYVVLVSSTDREVIKVTAHSAASDTFGTIVRAQEGTSAAAFSAGDTVELRLTAVWPTAVEAFVKDAELAALAGLTSAADKVPYFTGSGAAGLLTRDTDTTLAANSDTVLATQKATKAYVDTAVAAQPEVLMVAVSDETTDITTGTAKLTFRMPFACTMTVLPRANLNTDSSSGAPAIDINKNGVSIFSTTLTIDATEKTSVTAATPAVLSGGSTTFAADDEITIDIDTAGTGAKGLKITMFVVRTP